MLKTKIMFYIFNILLYTIDREQAQIDSWSLTPSQPWWLYQAQQMEDERGVAEKRTQQGEKQEV